jgi:ribonuclease P protein subunit POP4
MITPENLVRHELIGLTVEVTKSPNRFQIGTKGLVVDETKNLLAIETSEGVKKIQKDKAEFIFTIPGGIRVRVNGKIIAKRHEDRVKIKTKKW